MFPQLTSLLALVSLLPRLVLGKTAAQLCKGTSVRADDGNWYCSQVRAITYKNISQPGEYKRTTRVNPKTGKCEHETVAYSGVTAMTPLIGELSMHLRGPMNVSKLAVYKLPDMTVSRRSSTSRAHNRRQRKSAEALHGDTPDTRMDASPVLEKRWMCTSTPTVTVTVQVPATTCSLLQTLPAIVPAPPPPPPVTQLLQPLLPPVFITIHETTTFCQESTGHSTMEATSVPPCSSLHPESSCSCQTTLGTRTSSVNTVFPSASFYSSQTPDPVPASSLWNQPTDAISTSFALSFTNPASPSFLIPSPTLSPISNPTLALPPLIDPSSILPSNNPSLDLPSPPLTRPTVPAPAFPPSRPTSAASISSNPWRLPSLLPTSSYLWRLTSLTPTPSLSRPNSPALTPPSASSSTGGWIITRLLPTIQGESQPARNPTDTPAVPSPLEAIESTGNNKRNEPTGGFQEAEPSHDVHQPKLPNDVQEPEPASEVLKAAPAIWERVAYYTSVAPAAATGFAFLANLGDPQKSGTFDYSFGNSLGYVIGDGSKVASTNTAFNGTLATSEREIAVFTDRGCDGNCEYSRPDTVAHYGWAGPSKAFFIEFQMDHYDNYGNDQGMLSDAPAWWFLNAAIPRILQYGNDRDNIPCSCWSTGCGEFDAFEVLGRGEMRAKSTIHRQGNLEGGDSNYFLRPVGRMIKFAVVFHDWNITARVLDDGFDFSEGVTSQQIDEIVRYDPADSEHSLFAIGD